MSMPKKPKVNIGTIGLVDHGQTTLTEQIAKAIEMKGTRYYDRSYELIDADISSKKNKKKRRK